MAIKFASYNMHGINNGYSMLSHLCQQCDVILIQELQTCELQKLGSVDSKFAYLTVSAMDDKISKGILHGRPFGGTAVLWRKNSVSLLNFLTRIKMVGQSRLAYLRKLL